MEYKTIDEDFNNLIQLCKRTGNYKKINTVCLNLISNELHRIGFNLGIRPRKKEKEYCFQYAQVINHFVKQDEIELIPQDFINRLKTIELLFNNKQGEIPSDYTTELIIIYYELRKIEVPNFYACSGKGNHFIQHETSVLRSFYSGNSKKKAISIKEVYLEKLKQKERKLQHSLESGYNKKAYEKMLWLKRWKKSLQDPSNKVVIEGTLSENMDYQQSLSGITGYFYLGCAVGFIILSLVLILESILVPSLTFTLSGLLLVFMVPASVCFMIYWNNYREPEEESI